MTVTFDPIVTDPAFAGVGARVELCRVEARRYLRRASLWIGLFGTLALTLQTAFRGNEWSADKYILMVPGAIAPLAIGTFVAALRTGNRDRSTRSPALAPEAQLDGDDRAIARLVALVVPMAMAAIVMVAIGIGTRVEGGFWMGDAPRRSDTAIHSVLELLQPVLIVALVGAAGVAIGRAVLWIGPAMIIGGIVLFLAFGLFWMWNLPGPHAVTPIQTQPMWVDLERGTRISDVPADWVVELPSEYDPLRRTIVHTATVALHDLYLVGLIALCCGLALRRPPRQRLVVGGLLVAFVAVCWQLLAMPGANSGVPM